MNTIKPFSRITSIFGKGGKGEKYICAGKKLQQTIKKIYLWNLLIILVLGQPRYIYFGGEYGAIPASTGCSCVGSPAVVDTFEKQQYLLHTMWVPIYLFASMLQS